MKSSAFLIRVLICFLLSIVPLNDLENWIYSRRMELRGRKDAAANLVIVEVDEGATDQDIALLPNGLTAIFRQQPKTVLIPWSAARAAWPKQLRFNPRIITSSQFDSEGKLRSLLDPANLAEHTGFNNLFADSDGEIRRFHQMRLGEPSLVRVLQTDILKSKPPADPAPLINYMGPPGSVSHCRLTDFIARRAAGSCLALRGKIIILSQNLEKLNTPVGEMTRSEVLANAVYTVVNHKPIYRASHHEQMILILAMIIGAAVYIIYYPVAVSAIAISVSGFTLLVVVFQLIFHIFDIYIPSANLAASLLFSYLVFTGYRMAVQDSLQWRSLKQSQYFKELDQMKSNFLSLVSHDLKTPLAKIQATVERLRRESVLPVDERTDWKELFDSIENSNGELKHYISSVLNLSRIESQKVILNKRPNDINRVIQAVLKRLHSLAQNRDIQVEEHLEPMFSIEFDEDLVRQVLTNLVDNALKYSPPHSKVLVRSREEDGFVAVEIEDFGPGIPADQLPLMFRKFNRLSRPLNETVKGTGLGLYLSKYFIELHGGTIRVQSVLGRGTIFSFRLPLGGAQGETLLG